MSQLVNTERFPFSLAFYLTTPTPCVQLPPPMGKAGDHYISRLSVYCHNSFNVSRIHELKLSIGSLLFTFYLVLKWNCIDFFSFLLGIPLIICGITIAGNMENYKVED